MPVAQNWALGGKLYFLDSKPHVFSHATFKLGYILKPVGHSVWQEVFLLVSEMAYKWQSNREKTDGKRIESLSTVQTGVLLYAVSLVDTSSSSFIHFSSRCLAHTHR